MDLTVILLLSIWVQLTAGLNQIAMSILVLSLLAGYWLVDITLIHSRWSFEVLSMQIFSIVFNVSWYSTK